MNYDLAKAYAVGDLGVPEPGERLPGQSAATEQQRRYQAGRLYLISPVVSCAFFTFCFCGSRLDG